MSIDPSIVEQSVGPLLKGLKVTAQVCGLGIPLGIAAGTLAAYLYGSPARLARSAALTYVEIVRNVPFLILVYLSFFGLPKLGISMPAFAIGVARSCGPHSAACRADSYRRRARSACRNGTCSAT
jgi:polar amino acid transport system permease protein